MAITEHLEAIKKGVDEWNRWRQQNPSIRPDLSNADLRGLNLEALLILNPPPQNPYRHIANLREVIFDGTDLNGANLQYADLTSASLSGVKLRNARLNECKMSHTYLANSDLSGADLNYANLTNANLQNAILEGAYLDGASLIGANLTKANLTRASLIVTELYYSQLTDTVFEGATLMDCQVYGASVWNVNLNNADQSLLRITLPNEPAITVDNLEVAQFIFLLLNNERIRHVIDTITSKVVLILGRFTQDRKKVLDALRAELQKRGYLPVLFDFEKPENRDITETVSTLAHMAKFVIADITEAKSIPQELQAIVPDLPSVPIQPILLSTDYEYSMFEHFKRYPSVLEVHVYNNEGELLNDLEQKVINPAEAKAKELTGK